jgi:RNA polymerase sigma-70 factor (ECF subfamily)
MSRELRKRIHQARAAWPDVQVDEEAFVAHLGARAHKLEQLHLDDLYLAFACARGDAEAVAIFERTLLSKVRQFVARVDRSPQFAEEVQQILRARLLAGDAEHPPKVAEYSGVGPLHNWLRVAALRAALDQVRRRPEQVNASQDLAGKALAGSGDPEHELLRRRYRGEFQAALEAALGTLTAKERNLLRMHFVDGLGIDRLGIVYRVHRATAARWLQAARERLLEEIRQQLRPRLGLTDSQFDSLAGVLQGDLHVSMSRLFARPDN